MYSMGLHCCGEETHLATDCAVEGNTSGGGMGCELYSNEEVDMALHERF
jgi:hypothetical protein